MKKKAIRIAKVWLSVAIFLVLGVSCSSDTDSLTSSVTPEVSFVVTDTEQSNCYDVEGNVIDEPGESEYLYGQDAQYDGIQPSYTDNGDKTVTDNNTGLMWQQSPPSDKMFYDDAVSYVESLELGGYTDWRLPTIQESFSLAMLAGSLDASDVDSSQPYIDTDYFDFYYDEAKAYTGSYWTSTTTVKMDDLGDTDSTMEKNYGFNWADGHLKSYADGYTLDKSTSDFSIPAGVRAVRGEEDVFGTNSYIDNSDGTITDTATSLMWTQEDAAYGMDWPSALAYATAQNEANYLGYSDWRLPNPKELQSIVEYSQDTIPAIDTSFFNLHQSDCYVWTNTTCGDFTEMAYYVTFGHGWGIEISGTDNSDVTIDDFSDVHGPGCIRADYKTGTAPALSQKFYATITIGESYPGAVWEDGVSALSGVVYTDQDDDGDVDEFDLSNSENAADYVVVYNRVLLVRDAT
jgi:hypothetical protein